MEDRKHPRAQFSMRQTTREYMDTWLEDKHISKTGLMDMLCNALVIDGGENRFFKIIVKDVKAMEEVYPSVDKAWEVRRRRVKKAMKELDITKIKEVTDELYDACESYGVPHGQAAVMVREVLGLKKTGRMVKKKKKG